MAAWHDQSFAARSKRMGKDAEMWFRRWADDIGIAYVRFGYDLPPFKHFGKMTAKMRYAPDYSVEEGQEHFLVECKGMGRDGTVKIKVEQTESLQEWEQFSGQRVDFFIYDSSTKRISPRNGLQHLLDTIAPNVPLGVFKDWGAEKPYYAIPSSMLDWELTETYKKAA